MRISAEKDKKNFTLYIPAVVAVVAAVAAVGPVAVAASYGLDAAGMIAVLKLKMNDSDCLLTATFLANGLFLGRKEQDPKIAQGTTAHLPSKLW